MSNTGYNRSLGTSKKEQGILTPPRPKFKKCGCAYRGQELWQMCRIHQDGLNNILKNMQIMAQRQKAMEQEGKKDSPAGVLEEQMKKEDTQVSEKTI